MPYISNHTIEKIFSEIDIKDVVGHYVDLKSKGNMLEACCPFHEEKTPSFVVTPAKGLYKCFGCGAGGNAFQFVQRYEKKSTTETYEKLAEILNIKIEYAKEDKAFKEKKEQTLSFQEINQYAAIFYNKNIQHHSDALAELVARNVSTNDINRWQLGYADNSNYITNTLKERGKINDGLDLAIVSQKDGLPYDYFRNRITIPIHNVAGIVVGFGAKSLAGAMPKYINSKDSELYSKSNTLFGLFENKEAISKRRKVYICEGYFDVISLSRIGINHCVASCGTALTNEQAKLLKKYTSNVIIFYDGDAAGQNAAWKAMCVLLNNGFYVSIVTNIPAKQDPDDMARNAEKTNSELEAWVEENTEDALLYLSAKLYASVSNAYEKGEAITRIAEAISYIANTNTKQEYIKQICNAIDINKASLKKEIEIIENDRLKKIRQENPVKEKKESGPQSEEAKEDFQRYGFWADDRQAYLGYHFASKDGNVKVSNFILESLYLIHSQNDSKRIYKIKNENNVERIIELPIDAMTSLSKFQTNVEKIGKFIFEGSQSQINRLKHKLYEQEKACFEIKNLGWQKANFWAFANGVFFDDAFQEIDNHGIVVHNDVNYFIPALSKIYSNEDASYKNDKKFVHLKNDITFQKWAKLYAEVYNYADHFNGHISILFVCAAIYRDVIFEAMGNSFPLMFLFGPPGNGKNQLAYSLLSLFGKPQDQVNLNSNTKAGLTKRMAEFNNSLIFLDEFHNGLEDGTHQFLKSVFDGQTRTKSEMTTDDKTTSTPIRSSAIVAGQEKPISSGGALFSRCVFLHFLDRKFEKDKYRDLIEMQKKGITSVMLSIVSNRNSFVKNFKNEFAKANKTLNKLIDNYNTGRRDVKQGSLKVMDRLLSSYTALLATYYCLQNTIAFPFETEEIELVLFNAMKRQAGMISKTNDVSIFWEYIQALFYANGPNKLEEGKHFKIVEKKVEDKIITVLHLQFSSVHMLYQKEHRSATGKPAMDKSSLQDYLKNSAEYIGTESSTWFRDEFGNRTNNSSYMFDYEKLSKHINLVKIKDDVKKENSENINQIF